MSLVELEADQQESFSWRDLPNYPCQDSSIIFFWKFISIVKTFNLGQECLSYFLHYDTALFWANRKTFIIRVTFTQIQNNLIKSFCIPMIKVQI